MKRTLAALAALTLLAGGFAAGRMTTTPDAQATGIYADWCAYRIRTQTDEYGRDYKTLVVAAGKFGRYDYMSDSDIRRAATEYDCERTY